MGQEHVHPFDWWSPKHQEYILKVALRIQTQNQGFGNCLMQIMIQKWSKTNKDNDNKDQQ